MPPLPAPNQDKEEKSDVTSDIEDVIIKILIRSIVLAPAGALLWSLKKSRDKKESGIDTFVKDLLPFDPTSPLDPKKFFLNNCSCCLVWLLGLIVLVVILLGIGGYACTIQDFNWCKAIASLVALFK